MDKRGKYYDLFSLGVILFVAVIQLARWKMLPQFIDDYFHLHQALGFIKAGGWSGIAFWDYAPLGRPNLYPPFYHILLALLLKLGWGKVFVLRVVNICVSTGFFITVWYVLRKTFGSLFAALNLLILFSTFSFYASLCANMPATLALIFAFLSYLFLRQNKLRKCVLFAVLAFYTHTGISLAFFFSLLLSSFFCSLCLKAALVSFLFYIPFLFHQLRYIGYFHFGSLYENFFMHINPALLVLSLGGVVVCLRRKREYAWLLFFAFSLFAVFFRYPFRILSAQGVVGMSLLSAAALQEGLRLTQKHRRFYLAAVFIFFLAFNSSIVRRGDTYRFYCFYSSLAQFVRGSFASFLEFRNIASSLYFRRIVKLVENNSAASDIVGSNIPIASEIIGALADRSISSSMLVEVYPFRRRPPLKANIIVWFRQLNQSPQAVKEKEKKLCRKVVYADDISFVCFTGSSWREKVIKAKFRFAFIYMLMFLGLFFLIVPEKSNKLTPSV